IADLPLVPVDDLATGRVGRQPVDERATLPFGDPHDVVHAHAEDERLASRPVAPHERMLTPPAPSRTLAPRLGRTPARLLLRRRVRVRRAVRGLEAVNDA